MSRDAPGFHDRHWPFTAEKLLMDYWTSGESLGKWLAQAIVASMRANDFE